MFAGLADEGMRGVLLDYRNFALPVGSIEREFDRFPMQDGRDVAAPQQPVTSRAERALAKMTIAL
jgi:hypothetical protein